MSSGAAGARAFHPLGVWLPLAVSLGVAGLDVAQGPALAYAGVLTAVPLLASALTGPGSTLVVGLVNLLVAAGLGLVSTTGAGVPVWGSDTQTVRLVFIAGGTVLGVWVAHHRVRREVRAAQVHAVAHAAQRAIIAPLPARVGGVACASTYLSAAEEALIGGDLVEVLDTPWGVRAIVGDVRGKGMDAVRLAGRVLGSFREVAFTEPDLAAVACALDRAVSRSADDEGFVTAVLVQLCPRTGALLVVDAGHPAPYVVDSSGGPARELEVAASPPLGLFFDVPAATSGRLCAGERLVAVTDGLLEARRPRRFSRSAAGPFLPAAQVLGEELARGSMLEGLDRVVERARRWTRNRLRDDLAVLVLQAPEGADAAGESLAARLPVQSTGPRPEAERGAGSDPAVPRHRQEA